MKKIYTVPSALLNLNHIMFRKTICRKTQSVPPPEKTQGWISLSFMCNCFVFGLISYKCIRGQYKGHLGGLDKVFKIRDRHHRIHRQKLRQNEGIILILAQS